MERKLKTGCLLVHGFGGIPQEMLPLGKFLEGRGYYVRLVQLPGHGMDAGNAGMITWHAWLDSVQAGFERMAGEVDEIFLLGHSMGGLLALLLSARYPVRGVVGFAPICTFNTLQKSVLWVSGRLNRDLPTLGFHSPDGENLRIHLTSIPASAVKELHELVTTSAGELDKVRAPVLLFYGGLDLSVSASSGSRLETLLSNAKVEKFVLPWADHLLMLPRHRSKVWGRTLSFIQANSEVRSV
jgi:carboxylesterase